MLFAQSLSTCVKRVGTTPVGSVDNGTCFAGVGALQSRQALIVDAVDAMTVQAFLRASGFSSDYSLQRSSTAIEQHWTFQPLPGSQQA